MNNQHHPDDGSIPSLPSTYPLDPSLTADIHHHHHHGHGDLHGHHHAHDLDADASLAAEYFAATEEGGELSLNDAGGLGRESAESPMMHQEGQGQGSKPRKRKLQLACHFCRRRKLKCDGNRPTCDNCDKRNETCEWDDQVRRRGPGKRTKALRDRAADEAAGAGLHEATGMSSKHMDPMYSVDTATADTNAALIAAVTAAAAEGAGGMDDAFGTGDISSGVADGYGEHQHHGHEDGEGEESADIAAHLAEVASGSDNHHPLDPNIDPSLAELGPSTLADASSPTLSHSQNQDMLTPLEAQQLQAALNLQRREHLLQQHQQQQQAQAQRKLGGVGVGVGGGVQIQAPNFGAIQTPHGFGLSHLNGQSGGEGSSADVGDGDVGGADALDWDKGYNFSAWPDLDLGGATH